MLEQVFPPSAVRAIESGGDWAQSWDRIEHSGYLDALVPESAGGAALSMAEIGPLLVALGWNAVPLPVAETIAARALLARAGQAVPAGPIALSTGGGAVPFAQVAEMILHDDGHDLRLFEIREVRIEPTGVPGDLSGLAELPEGGGLSEGSRPAGGLRPLAALLRVGGIAGAANRVLTMTAAYAKDRVQFGKPIGNRQAVQQQIAVMAEQTVAARLTFELACSHGFPPPPLAAAAAKSVASAAAVQVANIAHAVHGAIGISAEHDLQLFTRALHAWRLADGGEAYWNTIIGRACLSAEVGALDWVRAVLFAAK
jgi:acyl-CoA dehydrogenase